MAEEPDRPQRIASLAPLDGVLARLDALVKPVPPSTSELPTALDIPNLLNQTGDTLEASSRNGDVLVFRIRKS